MQISPDQIRAARAMLDLNQADLARHANKPFSTVSEIERRGRAHPVDPADLRDIQAALEGMGIEFIPWGVRRLPTLTAEQQALYDQLQAISRASAAELKGHDRLTDDDMYDENGLPA